MMAAPAPRIVAVASRKGGAGKTTTTLNLAGVLAEQGQRVLLIDLDPQASLTRLLLGDAFEGDDTDDSRPLAPAGIGGRLLAPRYGLAGLIRPVFDGIDLVPGDRGIETAAYALVDDPSGPFRLRKLLAGVTDYDVVLLDTPPSLGFALNLALLAASVAIVPTQLSQQDFDALDDTIRMWERLEEMGGAATIVIVPNAFRNDGSDRGNILALRDAYTDRVAESIPLSVAVKYALTARQPVVTREPQGAAALAYRALATRVLRLEEVSHA